MDLLNRAYSQLYDLYRSMTPVARILTAGLSAAVALLCLGYLLTHEAAEPDVDLMHGVPVAAGQLPAMEAALGKANLKFKTQGASIRVPRGQEAAYMTALSDAKALPPNIGTALREAINASTYYEDPRQRELRVKAATQDDLGLMIRSISGIENAYVRYDVDKPGGFQDKVITATACVKPAGSSQLDEKRVLAIRHLVKGAIAGLKLQNVTVIDLNSGRTWSGNTDEAAADATANAPNREVPTLPPANDVSDAAKRVDATPSRDLALQEPPMLSFGRDALNWAEESWRTLCAIGLALVSLLVLRSMIRSATSLAKMPAKGVGDGLDEITASDGQAAVPPAHRRRHANAAGPSPREELSAIVEDDPEMAVSVLSSWIGQGASR